MTRATVICDASFLPRGRAGFGGWAAWVRVDGRPNAIKGYGSIKDLGMSSSNEAEIYAALNGIWLASRYGATNVLVRSDCMTVQHLITGKAKSQKLIKLWKKGISMPGVKGIRITSRHVKGHAQIKDAASYVNNWCDEWAGYASRQLQKGQPCTMILPVG